MLSNAARANVLIDRLRVAGQRVVAVRSGAELVEGDGDTWRVPSYDRESLGRVGDALGDAISAVVYLSGAGDHGAQSSAAEPVRLVAEALAIAQWASTARGTGQPLRLWCVTSGAQRVAEGDAVDAASGAVWGLARTVALEHPELHTTLVDVDASDASVEALAMELRAGSAEDQLAFRPGRRYVARLAPLETAGVHGPQELVPGEHGVLDGLHLVPLVRRDPAPHEVEVRVHASSLNFRDVLNALGLYPGPPMPLGNECAGVVERVGAEVTAFAPGDEVIALAGGAMRTHVVTPVDLVMRKPTALSFADAAAMPTAYLTAAWGLHHLSHLKAGQWLLLPSAAGGVGLAAIHLAHRVGARVIALAGSEQKRAFLRDLGVAHVGDSRSLAFVGEVRRIVGPAGVDVVLNSLIDEFIPAALGLLGQGGTFLEIGKRGVWPPERMQGERPDLRYHIYDLAAELDRQPAIVRELFADLVRDVAAGTLPKLPLRVFALGDAVEAFRHIAQARHIGKVLLAMMPTEGARDRNVVRSDGGYLISGGTGPLGLAVARWLVDRGAGSLVLLSRRGADASAEAVCVDLRTRGARVHVITGDVADPTDVERACRALDAPLRGIVHAAGVLDDAPLEQQSVESIGRALRPKVSGALALRDAGRAASLDFFVLFSGGAGLVGSAGQANYAAANAWLDAFAWACRAEGLPAISISWGAWAGAGMAGRVSEAVKRSWAAQGVEQIQEADGLRALEQLLERDLVHAAVMPTDWERAGANPVIAQRPLFRELVRPTAKPARETRSLRERLTALAPEDRVEALAAHVREQARAVLAIDPAVSIEPDRGLTELGMDSLMAVDLSNRLRQELAVVLPRTLAFEHPSIDAITNHLLRDVLQLPTAAPAPAVAAGPAAAAQGVDDLTLDEIERELLRELDRAER